MRVFLCKKPKHTMRRSMFNPTRCVLFSVITFCSYSILTICVFDSRDVSKFLSMILDIKVMNKTDKGRAVHGYGTIMVNVRKLGQLNFDEVDTTLKPKRQDSKCFQLFRNKENTSSVSDSNKTSSLPVHGDCNAYITLKGALGRTGNQMFQLAALLGTAYYSDVIPLIDPNSPLIRYFSLPNLSNNKLKNSREFSYHRSAKYTSTVKDLTRGSNWTMSGYFQSWRYFDNIKSVIKSIFRVKDVYRDEPMKFLSNSSFQGHTKVCIHVRRGDFMDESANIKGYIMADLSFVYRAIAFHRKRWKKVRFIVLSDGITWCKEYITGPDIVYSPFYAVAEDLALMTLCDHVVVTSGTFGWWGAWLSGGTTVYFKNYPRPGSWLDNQFRSDDYYPPTWIGL